MLELTGVTIGAVAYRRTRATAPRLLRAALLAQAADLVSLSFVWANSANEHNPIAATILRLALPLEPLLGYGLAAWVAFMGVAVLKACLMVYLAWASPYLGRYRRLVLSLAVAIGILGAGSNVIAMPMFMPSGA